METTETVIEPLVTRTAADLYAMDVTEEPLDETFKQRALDIDADQDASAAARGRRLLADGWLPFLADIAKWDDTEGDAWDGIECVLEDGSALYFENLRAFEDAPGFVRFTNATFTAGRLAGRRFTMLDIPVHRIVAVAMVRREERLHLDSKPPTEDPRAAYSVQRFTCGQWTRVPVTWKKLPAYQAIPGRLGFEECRSPAFAVPNGADVYRNNAFVVHDAWMVGLRWTNDYVLCPELGDLLILLASLNPRPVCRCGDTD